jgi:uncharacterized membrane protein
MTDLSSFRHFMKLFNLLSFSVSIIGIFVILWGVIIITIKFLYSEYFSLRKKTGHKDNKKNIRYYLGSYILLGLEFMIAGDIINTVLHPSKDALIVLGSIVAIRTVISYFLNKETQVN